MDAPPTDPPIGRSPLRGRSLAAIMLLYAGLLGLSIATWVNSRRVIESSASVDHTKDVLAEIEAALDLVTRDTALVRGYVLTGNPEFLAEFDATGENVYAHLKKLQRLTTDNDAQRRPLAELREACRTRVGQLAELVRVRRDQGLDAAIALVSPRPWKMVRDAAGRMERQELELLAHRQRVSTSVFRSAKATLAAGWAVLFLQISLVVILLNADFKRRQQGASDLAESHDRLRVTLRSIGDAVIVTDEKGRISFLNPVAEALTGWKSSEGEGRPAEEVFRIVNEDTRHPVPSPIVEALSLGRVVGLANHTVLISRSGREVPISDSGAPIRDDHGEIRGAVLVFREMTEQRRVERERAEARKIAEDANAQKDRFLAVLSHELRTPLSPVLSTIERLERRHDPSTELGAALRTIRRNVELEVALIDDLLDVTRIAQGKVAVRSRALDLHEKLLHVLDNCRSEAAEKGVAFEAALDAPEHYVRGDPARLQQVLWNVLKNGIKFTPPGGRVSVSTEAAGSHRIRIRVEDSGIGIPPEKLGRIFDAFDQGEATITRRFGGLGLGLAISKALVEAHGGTIVAESAGVGRGAAFVIELPAMARPADAEAPAARAVARPSARWNILVVEDHTDTAAAISDLLREDGHRVRVAHDVETAFALHEESPADLLITDVGLPDGNGVDLLARLGAVRPVRGIVVSGYGMEKDIERSRAAGFFAHLTKPFNVARLEEAVDQAMSGVNPADPGESASRS